MQHLEVSCAVRPHIVAVRRQMVKYLWSYTSTALIRLRSLDRDADIPPQIALKKHWLCVGFCIWLFI